MSIGISILIFFVSIIALVAEFVLYMIMGVGASFAGDISMLSGTAFFFVGLMVITGAIGILAPFCAIIGAISKNKVMANKIFYCLVVLVGLFYFIGTSLLSTNISSTESSMSTQKNPTKIDIEKPNPNGKWVTSSDINPIDDSKTITMYLNADSGKNTWGQPLKLIVRCKSNETNLIINWNDYLGSEANVLTRVGTNEAVTSPWSISTDSQATFHKDPVPFLEEMIKSNKLVAQVTPYNANPVTAIFDTSGLENAIKPLRETCGW